MFRPSWSERIAEAVRCAELADISRSRAVLIGLPATTTVEAGSRWAGRGTSVQCTARARRPLRVVSIRCTYARSTTRTRPVRIAG